MEGVAFIPGVGWIISGAYFIANTAIENATGKSIGQHIAEAMQDPVVQGGYQYQTQFPDF